MPAQNNEKIFKAVIRLKGLAALKTRVIETKVNLGKNPEGSVKAYTVVKQKGKRNLKVVSNWRNFDE